MGRQEETAAQRRLRLKNEGWIGVDFDGTLATYYGWRDDGALGDPIGPMVDRVKRWRADGIEVRVFTARAGHSDAGVNEEQREKITAWCLQHLGEALPITNMKDHKMIELWDDRAVQVVLNTGARADGQIES